jgi:competence protein ComEC
METRFRAFQLDSKGSLFSYWKKNTYTLIEARIPKEGIAVLVDDLKSVGKERIDILHITSWDQDHCEITALTQIMNRFRPDQIHIPSYEPDTAFGGECLGLISKYDFIHQKYVNNVTKYDKATIDNLEYGQAWGTNDIVYHSLYNVANHNDMSQIRLFRSNGFSVLSLGDCESKDITKYLLEKTSFLNKEVDVLVLPHHGSDTSMLTGDFIDYCKPSLAVCTSNYDNMHNHPHPAIIQLLSRRDIKLMTTKRGDVLVIQNETNTRATAINLVSNNQAYEVPFEFTTKRNLQ